MWHPDSKQMVLFHFILHLVIVVLGCLYGSEIIGAHLHEAGIKWLGWLVVRFVIAAGMVHEVGGLIGYLYALGVKI